MIRKRLFPLASAFVAFLLLLLPAGQLESALQLTESFDGTVPPTLPEGWLSSSVRNPSGDFVTTSSTPHTPPNAILSSDSKTAQWIVTPVFDFARVRPERLIFYERRSSSHNSGFLIDASTDGGAAFTIVVCDTLRNPGNTSYVRRELTLPAQLADRQAVRFRFRVVGNGTGSTGSLRIDDITIIVRPAVDLAVMRVEAEMPLSPGASTRLRALVENTGSQSAIGAFVHFYFDTDGDSAEGTGELIGTIPLPPLSPSDSTWTDSRADSLPAGVLRVCARVDFPGDGDPSNNTSFLDINVVPGPGSLIIGEILHSPSGGEPEWVELYNRLPVPVNLQGMTVANHSSSRYQIASRPLFVESHQYAVLTRDSAMWLYHAAVPSKSVIVPQLPYYFLSNGGDAVALYDVQGATIDSVRYAPAWGGEGGTSLERIDTEQPAADSTNWGSSIDPERSTPGRENSIARLERDIRVRRIVPGRPITTVVENFGRAEIGEFQLALYADRDRDSFLRETEKVEEQEIRSTLGRGDTTVVSFLWQPPAGVVHIGVTVDAAGDMNRRNDTAWCDASGSFMRGVLIMNEIMYEPLASSCEYVELVNRADTIVDLYGWGLANSTARNRGTQWIIAGSHVSLQPGSYVVLAGDSSIYSSYPETAGGDSRVILINGISLGNSGDAVVLTDPTGAVIDSLHYLPSWHNPAVRDTRGVSLERIHPRLETNDPRSWSSCVERRGGTPGKQNSIHAESQPAASDLSFAPNPFSPDGDGVEDFTVIQYRLKFRAARVRIRVFDAAGRPVRTLVNNEPAGTFSETAWDGRDDARSRVPVGRYIILLEAVDESGADTETLRGVVVVAVPL